MSLPRNRRVLKSAEFKQIYGAGVRMTSRYFTAFCLPVLGARMLSRVGFTTPRALGKAVRRNLLRRRMREAVRSELASLPQNWALVFNPKRAVSDAPFADLCSEVGRIFARCRQS